VDDLANECVSIRRRAYTDIAGLIDETRALCACRIGECGEAAGRHLGKFGASPSRQQKEPELVTRSALLRNDEPRAIVRPPAAAVRQIGIALPVCQSTTAVWMTSPAPPANPARSAPNGGRWGTPPHAGNPSSRRAHLRCRRHERDGLSEAVLPAARVRAPDSRCSRSRSAEIQAT
jgi:hypothetical protein